MSDMSHSPQRRGVLAGIAGAAIASATSCERSTGAASAPSTASGGLSGPTAPKSVDEARAPLSELRKLGSTGYLVERVSLGGEGALRTTDNAATAVPVILEALRQRVRYCDTAPAYAQSQDYYGEAFRAEPGARDRVFLATKTHIRDRDGALRLLDDSLSRLGTDHVDLWQMHDLRDARDLDEIFGVDGAIHAAEQAKADGRIKNIGLTGHHDPEILMEAMRRYDFDTVLCAINPADKRRLPFITTVIPEARRRKMGVIGMKVLAAGRLTDDGVASAAELIQYATRVADTVIIGCKSPEEVRQNIHAGRSLAPLGDDEALALEQRIAATAERYDSFKRV